MIFGDVLSPPLSLLDIYHDLHNFFPCHHVSSSVIYHFLSLSELTQSSLEEKK